MNKSAKRKLRFFKLYVKKNDGKNERTSQRSYVLWNEGKYTSHFLNISLFFRIVEFLGYDFKILQWLCVLDVECVQLNCHVKRWIMKHIDRCFENIIKHFCVVLLFFFYSWTARIIGWYDIKRKCFWNWSESIVKPIICNRKKRIFHTTKPLFNRWKIRNTKKKAIYIIQFIFRLGETSLRYNTTKP